MNMVWGSGSGTPMPTQSYDPGREYTPSSASQTFTPSSNEAQAAQTEADKWIAYAERVAKAGQDAATEASANQNVWERDKLKLQYEDAKKGRDNAIKLAQMTAEAARYGVDQQRKTALDQLKENQRQYDSNHALDMQKFGLEQQKFGLNVAEDYTKYASTPDLTFQRADLMEGLQRAGIGQGPAPMQGTPQSKNWNDWAALQGWATPTVQAGQTQQPVSAQGAPGAPGAPGAGKDPRVAAINGVLKAAPPSEDMGHSQSDFAALNAIQNLVLMPHPGALQKMKPGTLAATSSGLSRLGYYAPDALYDIKQAGVGQGSVRAA